MRINGISGSLAARAIPSLVPPYPQPAIRRAAAHLLGQVTTGAAAALPCGLALAGVAVSTWVSFHFDQSFAFTGFLHLVLVVLAALYGGFWQATFISIAAAACLNYFFVPPVFSFANSPSNWVALGAFEFTALVISRLSLRSRLRAMEAIAGRRDVERLYETSRRILLLDTAGEPGEPIASLIQETLICAVFACSMRFRARRIRAAAPRPRRSNAPATPI